MKIRPGCMSNIEVLVTTKEFTSFCGTAHCISVFLKFIQVSNLSCSH